MTGLNASLIFAEVNQGLRFLYLSNAWGLFLAALLLVVCLLLARWSRGLARELSGGRRATLLALRSVVVLLLLLLAAGPARMHLVNKSHVVVLVDTSRSMTLSGDVPGDGPAGPSRLEQAKNFLRSDPLLAELSKEHQITLATFDRSVRRLGSTSSAGEPVGDVLSLLEESRAEGEETRLRDAIQEVQKRERNLAGIVLVTDGVERVTGLREPSAQGVPVVPVICLACGPRKEDMPASLEVNKVTAPRWVPRLDSLSAEIEVRRLGREAEGETREGDEAPTVRLWLVDAPDVGQEGNVAWQSLVEGKTPLAEVVATALDEDSDGDSGRYRVTIPIASDRAGHYLLVVAATSPGTVSDAKVSPLDILDRREKVLLISSGGSRDFQFLQTASRYRPVLDLEFVFLGEEPDGSGEGVRGVPLPDAAALAETDIVVAFDPDWRQVPEAWLSLLETWVAKEGGGLITVTGPIASGGRGGWLDDAGLELVRRLYPVVFGELQTSSQGRLIRAGERMPIVAEGAWSEELPPHEEQGQGGEQPPFWTRFKGVHTCLAVEKVKPGATLLAQCRAAEGAGPGLAVAFARQRYGRGSVFYIGTSELWRMREVEEQAFYRFYFDVFRQAMAGRIDPEGAGDAGLSAGEYDDLVQNTDFLTHVAQASGGVCLQLNDREDVEALRSSALGAITVLAQEVECDRRGQRSVMTLLLLGMILPLLAEWTLRRYWQLP
ncbi:MAG: VWA domain-containing protein [Planctomycetia bacterium]|nr:VWA domain-containing protein [Planctomycetia bacterium]